MHDLSKAAAPKAAWRHVEHKSEKQDGSTMSEVRKNWKTQVSMVDDHVNVDHCRANFLMRADHEVVTSSKELCVEGHLLMVADVVMPLLKNPTITGTRPNWLVVEGETEDTRKALVLLASPQRGHYDEYISEYVEEATSVGKTEVSVINVEVTAHRADIGIIFKELEAKFGKKEYARIKWWYKENSSTKVKDLFLPPLETQLLPEFYPNLANPSRYLSDYLKDDAAILLVAGDPGTGKTTLLRHLICDFKLNAHIVYDEELMQSDAVFQNFLFEKKSDILIIEDADTILTSRESDGNKLMARFLNVSDGLIKLPNKKVVFTTNISDFSRVDQALLRPGRCFDLFHTRALNLTESQAAARAGGMPIPSGGKEYTLAELFNQGRKPVTVRRMGLTR